MHHQMVSYRRVTHNRATGRQAWLSLTPEPEDQLPRAIAALRAGDDPSDEAIAVERRRVERLVVRGRRRGWRRWISETRELAERGAGRHPTEARIAMDVIENHDALCLGLAQRGRGMGRGRGTR
jgi:hypothetical protein